MKKAIITVLIITLVAAAIPVTHAAASPGTSAASAILFDAAGKSVLYQSNIDQRMRIASTTKIMTALVVLDNCRLDAVVEIKPEYAGIEGSSMYIKAGEQLTVLELLYGLMLPSGNDAAVALACYVSGSVENFAAMMNSRAQALGCENSNFKNPHGLDADGHYSTARDLALITAEAMKYSAFCDIISTKQVTIAGRVLENHNRLLWRYDGMLGGKTGYTKSSGRSLVTCAMRDGMRLICVTLNDPDDWDDHTALYDWAFGEFQCVTLSKSDLRYISLPVISGVQGTVSVRPADDFAYVCKKTEKLDLTVETPHFVYAGVIKGARAGNIIVRKNGETVAEVPLVFSENVMVDGEIKLSGWERLKWSWYFANSRGGTLGNGYIMY